MMPHAHSSTAVRDDKERSIIVRSDLPWFEVIRSLWWDLLTEQLRAREDRIGPCKGGILAPLMDQPVVYTKVGHETSDTAIDARRVMDNDSGEHRRRLPAKK
jgi:hypothetical protein